jgi:hypothetical protein
MGFFKEMQRVGVTQTQKVKAIKFSASWVDPGSYGLVKNRQVVFELGLGPCGRHVVDLAHTISEGLLTVTQWSRLPGELTPPDRSAALSADHKLEMHRHASQGWEPVITHYGPPKVVTAGWWIFKSTFTVRGPEELVHNPNRPEGLLKPSEVIALQALVRDFWDSVRKWDEGVEIKTFVYKLSDVHGRIEVLK